MSLPYEYINDEIHERRERVFLVLVSLFIGSLAMLNILGISRFLDLSFSIGSVTIPFSIAVGVLPYPLTFLCTDFISELYGRARANYVVLMGLMINLVIVGILWVGGELPGYEAVDPATGEMLRDEAGRLPVFFEVRALTFGAVAASMVAYLSAQFCDVFLFHFWKNLTGGRHLWLRNNGSTLISQLVDTVSVILITHFYAQALPVEGGQPLWPQLFFFIASGYSFKLVAALMDTVPFYLGVRWLSAYLQLDPSREHGVQHEG
jgi:queuosine precursor transporter